MKVSKVGNGRGVSVLLICAVFTLAAVWASEPDLISKVLQTEFARVNRVAELPTQVNAAVTGMLGGQQLADPVHLQKLAAGGKPASGPSLLFAGKSPSLWLVQFTRGGQESGYELVLFEMSGTGGVVARGHLISPERAWSVPNLKNMLRLGAFKAVESQPRQ